MTIAMSKVPGSASPREPSFWFAMSMALLCGALVAYPMNWWLVARHLKHGMMTVRISDARAAMHPEAGEPMSDKRMSHALMARPSAGVIAGIGILSVVIFAIGIAISVFLAGLNS